MTWTGAQRSTFDTFYTTEISGGGGEFTFTDPTDGVAKDCRLVSVPSYEHLTGQGTTAIWRVSLEIEVLP